MWRAWHVNAQQILVIIILLSLYWKSWIRIVQTKLTLSIHASFLQFWTCHVDPVVSLKVRISRPPSDSLNSNNESGNFLLHFWFFPLSYCFSFQVTNRVDYRFVKITMAYVGMSSWFFKCASPPQLWSVYSMLFTLKNLVHSIKICDKHV